ncbi:hypothetical protein C9374_006537 [Naegleria lovaniensis]|uniref:RWP-RK domain-containing protein n=1 Tax=Naegleria lovaniensis TaxID=51637 RepID=A0AA88KHB9_NAELO|nr:uncharacterized protein C9374_006537 [Naegleria lovaniensis]KAG2379420.1 hypothetical protein C9374_006537 [Naegleria lovaniensis]
MPKESSKKKKTNTRIEITREMMTKYFYCPQTLAARLLGVSISTLKRRFYDLHIGRWPYQCISLNERKRSIYFLMNETEPEDDKELDEKTLMYLRHAFRDASKPLSHSNPMLNPDHHSQQPPPTQFHFCSFVVDDGCGKIMPTTSLITTTAVSTPTSSGSSGGGLDGASSGSEGNSRMAKIEVQPHLGGGLSPLLTAKQHGKKQTQKQARKNKKREEQKKSHRMETDEVVLSSQGQTRSVAAALNMTVEGDNHPPYSGHHSMTQSMTAMGVRSCAVSGAGSGGLVDPHQHHY